MCICAGKASERQLCRLCIGLTLQQRSGKQRIDFQVTTLVTLINLTKKHRLLVLITLVTLITLIIINNPGHRTARGLCHHGRACRMRRLRARLPRQHHSHLRSQHRGLHGVRQRRDSHGRRREEEQEVVYLGKAGESKGGGGCGAGGDTTADGERGVYRQLLSTTQR